MVVFIVLDELRRVRADVRLGGALSRVDGPAARAATVGELKGREQPMPARWHGGRLAEWMAPFQDLPAWDADAGLRVVVETPKGSAAKLRYDVASRAFTYQRPLPKTLLYPYDFGFVPGTLADDGDPLDALVFHDAATWPGVVIPCRPIALLKIADKKHGESSARQNHRLIAVPAVAPPTELSDLQRLELEDFFRVVGQQIKEVTILGWGDAQEARDEIERTIVDQAKRRTPDG